MAGPLQPSGSYSELYEDDDAFLEELRTGIFPGDEGYEEAQTQLKGKKVDPSIEAANANSKRESVSLSHHKSPHIRRAVTPPIPNAPRATSRAISLTDLNNSLKRFRSPSTSPTRQERNAEDGRGTPRTRLKLSTHQPRFSLPPPQVPPSSSSSRANRNASKLGIGARTSFPSSASHMQVAQPRISSPHSHPPQTDKEIHFSDPPIIPVTPTVSHVTPSASEPKVSLPNDNLISVQIQAKSKADDDTYAAASFGGYGDYMRRKKAKLQIQNTDNVLSSENADNAVTHIGTKSAIFKGISIYVNGYTNPSVQELRTLIVEHGGTFQQYIDRKSLVTHIITNTLTAAKLASFKHMRVAQPAWLVDSIQVGRLLPWTDYKIGSLDKIETAQGRVAGSQQREMMSGFVGSVKDVQVQTPRRDMGPPPVPPAPRRPAPVSVIPLPGPSATSYPNSKSGAKPSLGAHPFAHPKTPAPQLSRKVDPRLPQRYPVPAFGAHVTPVSADSSRAFAFTGTSNTASKLPSTSTAAKSTTSSSYAPNRANPHAERAMQSPSWRASHTSAAGKDFIEGYYKHSRLHYLSMWKSELVELVSEAAKAAKKKKEEELSSEGAEGIWVNEDADLNMSAEEYNIDQILGRTTTLSLTENIIPSRIQDKGKGKLPEKSRVIMHVDFDCFFVSVGLIDRPELREKPVVVCHSQNGANAGVGSTSEIASSNYAAREFGVRNGMSLQQAKKLCPSITTIPYEFEKYKQVSLQFYTILMSMADDLQAVSVDEALIEVTEVVDKIRVAGVLGTFNDSTGGENRKDANVEDCAKELAEKIRATIRESTKCEASIGISHNISLARLATRRAKPASSFYLSLSGLDEFLIPLKIDDLHGFGHGTREKAQQKLGTIRLVELKKQSKSTLCEALGKGTGERLYDILRGIDEKKLESDRKRGSVSCDINYGIRFENQDQVEIFMFQLAEEVSRRLDAVEVRGGSMTLKVMKRAAEAPTEAPKFLGHGHCDTFTKQTSFVSSEPNSSVKETVTATRDPKVIGQHAWKLLKSLNVDPKELRGIGIQIQKLEQVNSKVAIDGNVEDQEGDAGKSKRASKVRQQGIIRFPTTRRQLRHLRKAMRLEEKATKKDLKRSITPVRVEPVTPYVAPSGIELPSFSQVDQDVFNALPGKMQDEIQNEYKRRSESPYRAVDPILPLTPPRASPRKHTSSRARKRARMKVGGALGRLRNGPPRHLRYLSTLSDLPAVIPPERKARYERLIQQLAPRSKGSFSPRNKHNFFAPRQPEMVKVTEEELYALGIDPVVFIALPLEVQREQLAGARYAKTFGTQEFRGLVEGAPRKVLKPYRVRTRAKWFLNRIPNPDANFVKPPSLKQNGATKGEKLSFTEADDVQNVIQMWLESQAGQEPNQRDVELFAKFLRRCADGSTGTDTGIEKATAIMKWWRCLLRRRWKALELVGRKNEDHTQDMQVEEDFGKAWWKAFWDVKGQLDVIVRQKFGGSLSLK